MAARKKKRKPVFGRKATTRPTKARRRPSVTPAPKTAGTKRLPQKPLPQKTPPPPPPKKKTPPPPPSTTAAPTPTTAAGKIGGLYQRAVRAHAAAETFRSYATPKDYGQPLPPPPVQKAPQKATRASLTPRAKKRRKTTVKRRRR